MASNDKHTTIHRESRAASDHQVNSTITISYSQLFRQITHFNDPSLSVTIISEPLYATHLNHLLTLSSGGWRFFSTSAGPFSGVWALLHAFKAPMDFWSRTFSYDVAWRLLAEYFQSPAYWEDATDLMAQLQTDRLDMLQKTSFFTDLQIQLFAKRLSRTFLRADEEIDLTFLWQPDPRRPERHLYRNDVLTPGTTTVPIFIHNAGSHYQGLTTRSSSRMMTDPGRDFRASPPLPSIDGVTTAGVVHSYIGAGMPRTAQPYLPSH